ncbi:MAG: TonB-dependent receptor [Muribaculum sp.]|nr:TonB-dependent receptor [Muribaculaceae bacterium]MCM1081754.1 TonB-dependent receptor [Muribaculum sp.]
MKFNCKFLYKNIRLAFIILLVSSATVRAQVRIHGKVTNGDNEAIEFATVRVAGTAVGTTTGLDGAYTLTTAKADTIKVVFTCLGYKEQERKLIDADGDVSLNVRMFKTTRELMQVEVTEFKKQTTPMQSIDVGAYRLAPDVSGGSIESLITTMAGVNSSNEMSSQYSVRGGSYDENLVYINGIEVYRPLLVTSGQQEGLSIINPDMVDKVNFSTGGFTPEYADRMSSVLDITYRQPEAFEGNVSGSLMGGSLSLGQSSKRFSQMYGLRYKRNNSLLSSMETRGEYDPNFLDFQTNINYRITSRLKASFLGNIAINNYKFTPVDRTTNFGTMESSKQFKVYFDGREKDRFETYFGAVTLQYTQSRTTNYTLLASGYLTNELVAYDISGEYWLDEAGTSGEGGVGGELGVGRYHEHARDRLKASVISVGLRGNTAIGGHGLSYGLTLNNEKIYERTREWELRDSAGFSLPSHSPVLKMIYNLTSNQDISSMRMGMFVQDSYRLETKHGYLGVNGGIRLSYWDFNKEWLVSPRVNMSFIPAGNSHWAFRLAAGLYYQAPFFKEMRQIIADENGNNVVKLNKDIKSQRSLHFILGSDYTFRAFNRPFKFSAEAYYKALSNLIPYEVDNLKVVYDGVNSTNGFAAGLDMKLFGQFVPGSDSWISFSLMKTQENLRGVKVPRPNDQRYSFALYFTDYFPKYPKLKLSLRGIFADGLPTTAPRSSRDKNYFRTPAYKRVDLGFSYALLSPLGDGESRGGALKHIKSVWLGLDFFNLFDISNVNSYYWVTDVNNIQYAVPNYLTRRQVNVRLTIDF